MSQPGRGEKLGLAGVAAAALAVVCCAAGPLLLAWVGSVAVGALVGIGAGVAVLVSAVTCYTCAADRAPISRRRGEA